MARIPEILAAAAILLPGCASADTPRPTNGPVVQEVIATATAVPCDSEEFARKNGFPTPVPVGGGEAPAGIVEISRRLSICASLSDLSDAEREAFIKFNIAHHLLETVTEERAQNPIPPATKPPENKVESPSRLIIPLEYYSKAELVEWKTLQGTIRKMIGFKEANIPFLAPEDLQVTKNKINEPATFHGFEINMFDPNKPNRRYILKGALDIGDGYTINVKSGTIVSSSQATGRENLGYKVLFYILNVDQNTHIASDDEQTLREMFPTQFQGSPQTSSDYRGPDKPATNYEDTFYSTKK